MNSTKAILFDLGGTLLYPDFPYVQALLRERNLTITLDQFLLALSKASNRLDTYMKTTATTDATRVPEYIKYLLEELQVPDQVEELVEHTILPRHKTVNFWNYLLEGTLPLLKHLKQQYALAMISNSDGRAASKAAQYGIAPYMDFIIDSHFEGVEKPDPRIFINACKKLNLPVQNCYYVGDIYSIDVIGAKAAGLHPVLIDKTGLAREDCMVIPSIFTLQELAF